jgi:hypothetical protein
MEAAAVRGKADNKAAPIPDAIDVGAIDPNALDLEALKALVRDAKSEYHKPGGVGPQLRARYAKLRDAEAAAPGGELLPLPPRALKPLGQEHGARTVVLPKGIRREHLTNPELWVLAKQHCRSYDLIYAIAADESFFAVLLMRANETSVAADVVELSYTKLPPRKLAGTDLPVGYTVEFDGLKAAYMLWRHLPNIDHYPKPMPEHGHQTRTDAVAYALRDAAGRSPTRQVVYDNSED